MFTSHRMVNGSPIKRWLGVLIGEFGSNLEGESLSWSAATACAFEVSVILRWALNLIVLPVMLWAAGCEVASGWWFAMIDGDRRMRMYPIWVHCLYPQRKCKTKVPSAMCHNDDAVGWMPSATTQQRFYDSKDFIQEGTSIDRTRIPNCGDAICLVW